MSAVARWDGFLAQIETRHREVRAEAEAEGRAFLTGVAGGGDYLPWAHKWSSVEARLMELETKIEDTWHAKVDDAIVAEGVGEAARTAAFNKGRAQRHGLEDARNELEWSLMADFTRQRYAIAAANRPPAQCHKCGAGLAVPHGFITVDLPCGGCGATTRYEPGELMRSVGAVGSHAVPQMSAIAQWRHMQATDRALNAMRPPVSLDLIKAHEKAQLAYWQAYFTARTWFEPVLGNDLRGAIASRMDPWYQGHAEFHPAWVSAGRPREPLP
ncbi:MAG: hypothetical protein KBG28_10380 [Kofleriaceae bacterium]|nr:hypothetical protein [Kofleriaceae bacterium]MBP9204361.1 hypothetical protein [Kofleriaceae bacterium]